MTFFNKIVITGGAGFLGSHLVDYIIDNKLSDTVVVIDNLSSGSLDNLARHLGKDYFRFIKADLKIYDHSWVSELKDCDLLMHFAANPEVRVSVTDPVIHFNENLLSTFNVLEAARKNNVKYHVFASTSTVYGDAKILPTPEDYHPLEPISVYGAVKLSSEFLYITYSKLYDMKVLILRYANIIGPRARHGVIIDFIRKLRTNPRELEILGDGTQRKSYLHVSDAIEATFHLIKIMIRTAVEYDIYNVGNDDWISVKEIADIVVKEMNLKDVKYVYRPSTRDGRGWPGDVKFMLLDITKIKRTGWRPTMSSREAVRKTVRQILGKE